jgi:hypothetical protein
MEWFARRYPYLLQLRCQIQHRFHIRVLPIKENVGFVMHKQILLIALFLWPYAVVAEVQTTLNMTVPALVMGTSGTFSATSASGPAGTNSGTVLHSYAGVEQFIQTGSTGRFAPYDGVTRYGIGFDTLQIFQSFISSNYFTLLNSGTTCPTSGTYDWIMVRLRTPDTPEESEAMNTDTSTLSVGGTFTYASSTSTFTGTKYFNLSGPSLIASPSYGIAGFNSAVCSSGKNLATSTGVSSLDQYLYVYYGTRSIAIVSSDGDPEVIVATPQQTLTGNMTPLANYVFTGIVTYFQNVNTQSTTNVYLYPNASATTYTLQQETSLTNPTQYTSFGTLTCTNLDSPTTGFCSGTLTLQGVTGTGNAVCQISQNSAENLMMCVAQYPNNLSNPVTIMAKTVNQAVVQVTTTPSNVASVAAVGDTQTLTATVQNLSSRYVPSIGNPGGGLNLTAPWSNTGAYGGGSGTCGTSLNAYTSCTFPVTFTASAIGTNTSNTLRVNYNNGVSTPNATDPLIGVTALTGIALTPTSTNENNLSTTQMTATATYTGGTTQNVTSVASWTSSNTSVGTISTAGLASWLTTGSSTITGTLAGQSGTSNITVITPVVLTTVANQNFPSLYLNQGSTFTQDFNNIAGGTPGNDTNMSYTCVYDQVVDGVVNPGTACTSLPGTASFNTTTGIFSWTPNATAWGPYEISVTGTLSTGGSADEIFVIDVRPQYVLTDLRGDFEAQFANLTSNYSSANYYWDDLTTNAFVGTLSSTTHGTWVGNGSYSSPYALSLDGAATVDFGSPFMSSQTRMMFDTWIRPSVVNQSDTVILGSNTDGSGNGFNLRQSRSTLKHLDFSVGLEATYTSTISNLSPTAYYRLDQTSGTTLTDISGNGYNLTLGGSGTTLNVTGAVNGDTDTAIQFNGSGYACNTTSNSLTGTFSVEAWVNPASSSGTLGILGATTPSTFSFSLAYNAGQFLGEIGNGTSWLASAANTSASYTTLNAWYHVVYVVTPTAYTIYVDGVSAGSGSYSSSTPVLFNSTHNLCVGAEGSNVDNFNGKLDEVAVYNYALTSNQVSTHYNLGRTYLTTVVGDLPTAFWRLNETSGTTLFDATANGYNLTLSGSGQVYNQTGSISGDSDGSLQFNGNAYACRTSGSTSLTGTFSVEAWVNPSNISNFWGIVGSRSPNDESFDMKYQAGVFHGDVGNGSAWLSTAADTPSNYTTLNTWYHVVYVVTPTSYTIYVNGTNAGTGSWSSSTPILFDSTHNLCVGADGSNFEDFEGELDDVAIYNYPLTSTQVSNHYNTGVQSGAGTTSCTSISSFADDVWNHVSGLYDGTNAILFVNGRQECSMTAGGSISSPMTDVVAGGTSGSTKLWSGLMAQFRMYSTSNGSAAATAATVNTNFSATADMFRAVPVGNIVTNGLVLNYDAANATRGLTFPGIGIGQTSWFDLSPSIMDGTLNSFTGSSSSEWVGTGTTSSPYALAFDGVAANVSSSYVQTGVTGYTIEVWVNTTDSATEQTFVNDRGASGAGQSLTLGIGTTGGGHGGAGLVGWELDSNSVDIGVSSTTAVNDGNWHQVVGTWAASSGTAISTSQFTIYIDDAAASTTTGSTGSATSPLTGLSGTSIGYHPPWATYFKGSIAKVAIYNRALSSAEVKQNCNAIVGRFSGGVCH